MKCIECEHFKIIQHPLPDHYDTGRAECKKYNLCVDFFTKSKLNRLTCEDRPRKERMTREDAIVRLEGLYGNGYPEQEEALNMAISALSVELCDDCISRNDVIKMLNTMDRYTADKLKLCDTDKEFPHNEVFIVDDVYEGLDLLPSVQPKKGEPTLEEVEQYAMTHDLVLWTREESEEVCHKLLSMPKKGEWIKTKDQYGTYHFTCSKCGNDIATKTDAWDDNFCSECGADMRRKSCNTCKNSDDEFSGECYECLKGIFDHYEPKGSEVSE